MALKGQIKAVEKAEIDVTKAQALTHIVNDLIAAEKFLEPEVIVAMLTVIGQQYAGRPLNVDELTNFILEGADWACAYWHPEKFAKYKMVQR